MCTTSKREATLHAEHTHHQTLTELAARRITMPAFHTQDASCRGGRGRGGDERGCLRPRLCQQDRTRLRASGCFPIELVPPPPANAGRGAAKLLDLVRPLSDCIEKRLVGWFAIARTGRTRYVAHRVWPAVDSRGTWGRALCTDRNEGATGFLRPGVSGRQRGCARR